MALFKKLFKSDAVKVLGGAAAGYALSQYAPQLQQKATQARQWVQAKRKSLFPNYNKGPADAPIVQRPGDPPIYSAQAAAGSSGSTSLLDMIMRALSRLFGTGGA